MAWLACVRPEFSNIGTNQLNFLKMIVNVSAVIPGGIFKML